jgi:CrcB protein
MNTLLSAIFPISVGASVGAVLRWVLATRLNSLLPFLPPGTLVANLLGGYLIGVALAYFALHADVPAYWRLLVITGFLGGLTTFSTFSAEVVTQLHQGQMYWALAIVGVHTLGSFAMTALGMATVDALHRASA